MFSSSSTRSCKCIGMRRPFCCLGTNSIINCVFNVCFLVFPIRTHSCAKFSLTHCLIADSSWCRMACTFCFCCYCISLIPMCGNKFLPIMFAFLSSTTMSGADCTFQPLDSIAIINLSFGAIVSAL